MALITVQEYKDFVSINGDREDPQIQTLIDAVTAAIQNYIGYSLGTSGEITRVLTKAARTTYMTDSVGVSLSSVTYKNIGIDAPAARALTEDEDYFFDPGSGILQILNTAELGGSGQPLSDNGILVMTYNQDTSTVPEDIKQAAKLLVKFYYKHEYNQESVSANGQSVSYITGRNFPPHVSAILNLHRIL